jgi:hypothetical protein
MIQGLLETFL